MSKRLMYHHHIITREDNETIKKVFMNQKESHVRGVWYTMIISDFEFIEEEILFKKKIFTKKIIEN